VKDQALAAECRDLSTLVENLRIDPHLRTAHDTAVLLGRLVALLTHLAARIDQLEPQRPAPPPPPPIL
jgi:hypothetical protein